MLIVSLVSQSASIFRLHTPRAWRLLRFDGNLSAQCASDVSLCAEEIRLKFNRAFSAR